jgi:hypothetical protein
VRGRFMAVSKEMVERRKHRRFQVPKSAFVGFGPYDVKVGQIIDVSTGGLAFRYVGTAEPSNGELTIIVTERDFYVSQIPFRTVSDFEIAGKTSPTSVAVRRSGVQFGDLTEYQKSQLQHFVHSLTLGEA